MKPITIIYQIVFCAALLCGHVPVLAEIDDVLSCRERDSLALLDFHNSLLPTNRPNWNFNKPISTFSGVMLSPEGCVEELVATVVTLDSYDGYVPRSIGQLTNLRLLDLSDNDFKFIPEEIGSLTELAFLDLSNNFIQEIPVQFENLVSLRHLDLNNNVECKGNLNFLSSYPELEYIDLSLCDLTGTIPNDLQGLKYLFDFRISFNNISGTLPDGFYESTRLRTVMINNNNLSGPLKSDIGKLIEVEVLNIHGNEFEGELPQELGLLTNCTQLRIQSNKFEGRVPGALNGMLALRHLDVSDNDFTEMDRIDLPINYFDCSFNGFTYEDLLPNRLLGFQTRRFSPQDTIFRTGIVIVPFGEEYMIQLDFDHDVPNSQYVWRVDDEHFKHVDTNALVIPQTTSKAYGQYICWIYNNLFNDMNLVVMHKIVMCESTFGEVNEILCEGDSIEIAGVTFDANHTSDTILMKDAAVAGCDSLLYVNIEFATEPIVNDSIVHRGSEGKGAIHTNVEGNNAPYRYKWSNGKTSKIIRNLSTDTYTLTLTDASGCEFLFSYTVDAFTSTDDFEYVENMILFPNPVRQGQETRLTFHSSSSKTWTYSILNPQGRVIEEQQWDIQSGANVKKFTFNTTGLYLLQIRDEEGNQATFKIFLN